MNLADEIGSLRIIANTMDDRQGPTLRFRCLSCERFHAADDPEPAASPSNPMESFVRFGNECAMAVPEGEYPLIAFDGGHKFAVVLPFKFETWKSHLLHDIRPEWNRFCILLRGVHVQEWERQEKRRLYIRGER